MTSTMLRARRVGLGVVVAAFSVGIVATSTGGTALLGSAHPASVKLTSTTAAHAAPMHRWGN